MIEIQNSPIRLEDVRLREEFYGKNNLIWIINGATLANKTYVVYPGIKAVHYIYIKFPLKNQIDYFIYKDYSVDDMHNLFRGTDSFSELYNRDTYYYSAIQNEFKFEYTDETKFDEIFRNCETEVQTLIKDFYGEQFYLEYFHLFKIEYGIRQKSKEESVHLKKRYWRTFLDVMKFPVFFENLSGLEDGDLYYYQKNQIISKQVFLKKYLAYT